MSGATAGAQTVQLPTFEFFGGATTVVVPNQGQIAVVGSAGRVGMRDRATFAAGQAGSRTLRGIGATAVVHDLAALDRAALATAARLRTGPPVAMKKAPAPPAIDQSTAARATESLREIRRAQQSPPRS
jgi:hypothetical protein